VPLAQTASQLQQVQSAMDTMPLEAIQSKDSLEDLSRSIDAAEQLNQLHEESNSDVASKAVDLLRTPAYDEPSITGLRKQD
jgi:hypothetical protein